LLDVVDAVVEAAVVEALEPDEEVEEVDEADGVEPVDTGAADEPDEETEAELDVMGLTTAVAAPENGQLALCYIREEDAAQFGTKIKEILTVVRKRIFLTRANSAC
jgi:hypothetical protein